MTCSTTTVTTTHITVNVTMSHMTSIRPFVIVLRSSQGESYIRVVTFPGNPGPASKMQADDAQLSSLSSP